MWNLQALAQRAQEAAARIEAHLDESVGIKDDGGAGGRTSRSASSLSPAVAGGQQKFEDGANINDDSYLNEDDDFFSDDNNKHNGGAVTSSAVPFIQPAAESSSTLNFDDKNEGGVHDNGAEFVGDKSREEATAQKMIEREDEEVNFGGNGWEEEGDVLMEDVTMKTESNVSFEDSTNDEANGETISNNIAETNYEVERAKSPEYLNDNNAPAAADETDVGEGEQILTTESESEITPKSNDVIPAASTMDDAEKQQFLETIALLESQLMQREEQLASKSDQITSLTLQSEVEIAKLRQVISETKDEAKKRILRAKERAEEMQAKLNEAVRRADAVGGSNQEQSDIIQALRAEGEQLARKQRDMEQSVRNAKGEARDLQEKLDIEHQEKEKALAKVDLLEKEMKSLKDDLTSARKGESQSKKLEADLIARKEESEKQRASNLGLEQQLKELKEENKVLTKEVEAAKSGAALQLEGESNKLRKERDEMLSDLESKLRTSEREANVREDALRHEVSELRKRWQDAVRRAEDLSMDVQQSTAPLLRQLESAERQSRSRCVAWGELEAKLRSEIEEQVIQLEKLTKERNDLRANDKRSHRLLKEKEAELATSQETIDELAATVESLESKLEELEDESKKMKDEWVKVERQATEGVAKARNDMMKTVVDSEERYRLQIEALEDELEVERQKRCDLVKQLDDLAKSVDEAAFSPCGRADETMPREKRPKKLRATTNQASILQDTLAGFDSDVDEEDEDNEEINQAQNGLGSFAAMEQLSLGLKGAKVEVEALRRQLESSEETRESLVAELGEARQAAEKLPLFEEKVSELMMEVNLKNMEIKGLQEDIADVRFLYRTQLDSLLEERAALSNSSTLLEGSPELSSSLQD